MSDLLVSIVTPNRNGGIYLEDCMKSVLSQKYKNIEYIVIDGMSTDCSIDIITRYHNSLQNCVIEKDNGMYEAINKGFKLAKGDIVGYLNSDDLYYPETISTVVNIFQMNPDINLIYGNLDYINSNGKRLFTKRFPKFKWHRFASAKYSMIGQPAAFWRRSLFEKIGYFNESMKMASDFEFFIRAGINEKLLHVNTVLAAFRMHPSSLSSSQILLNQSEAAQIHATYVKSDTFIHRMSVSINDILFKLLNWRSLFK